MKIPIEVYTDYSIQYGFTKIKGLVARAAELGFPAVGISDLNSLSGVVEFLQEVKKHNASHEKKIKPIIGVVLNDGQSKRLVVAKNKNGYYNLIRLLNNLPLKFDFDSSNLEFPLGESPVFYTNPEEKMYHQIIVCSKEHLTLATAPTVTATNEELARFFDPQLNFALTEHSGIEIAPEVLASIEAFDVADKPRIPVMHENATEVLLTACRAGWKKRDLNAKIGDNPDLKKRYVDRITEELTTFKKANIENYFLILKKYISDYAAEHGVSIGLRGSGAGTIVSFLLGLSDVDPIQPDPTLPWAKERELSFSRFYNDARNTKDHVSMPDLDMDVPISFRNKLIQHIKKAMGDQYVGFIITFNRLDGKGAIKEIFRILEPVQNSFDIANMITKEMVDTSKVQDVLADLQEDNPDYNIIQYNIDHVYRVGQYYAQYKEVFDIAIKLGSSIRSTGRHAAGIVISDVPLAEAFPILYDKDSGEAIVALEMVDLEYCGGVKYDILGVAAYEKIDRIMDMINNDRNEPIIETEFVEC